MTDTNKSNEPDEGQKRIMKAEEELFKSLQDNGAHLNFGDCYCKYCHIEMGSCESKDGLPWDIKFVCPADECLIKQVNELESSYTSEESK